MKRLTRSAALVVLALAGATAFGQTYLPVKARDTRKVEVLREYVIAVTKGRKSVAAIPAMMSFWGATNEQVILRSEFTYSLNPDKVAVVVPEHFTPRAKVYQLTWEAPKADTVKVAQKLLVEVSCANVLATAAKLPYSKEVQAFYASALAKTDDINPENPKLESVAKLIIAKSKFAVDAMELGAVWVDENIKFKSKANGKSDNILADGLGNCVGMSKVLCALLRKLGIPAETVDAEFIPGNGHMFVEAYLPDAGWVFYDPSNGNHGFKCCDVLMTTGWGFLTFQGEQPEFHQGAPFVAKDVGKYEDPQLAQTPIRPFPKDKTVAGVRVIYQATPKTVKVRHLPLSMLVVEESPEPGKGVYKPAPAPWATTSPPAAPAGKAAAKRAG
jgi:hypothetical protein